MPIEYHIEDVEFELPNEANLSIWLLAIADKEEKVLSQINFIFCSDEYLLNINKEYLNHDYYTDIITFPYKEGQEIESDIFISIDRVKENAKSFETTHQNELLRVMAHGILHLAGYNDKSDQEAEIMREKENQCIALFK